MRVKRIVAAARPRQRRRPGHPIAGVGPRRRLHDEPRAGRSLTSARLTADFGTAVGQEQPNVNIPLPPYVPLPAAFAETETRPAKANVSVPLAAAFAGTVVPATAHANPQPAHRQRLNTSQDASGFDWASAGIGAAATGGLMLIAVGGFGAVHRARIRPAR